jgi:hypothetical protein
MKEPMDAVRRYVDGFNRGDVKTMASIFALPGMILDGMAPHVWHGTTAAQDWYRDVCWLKASNMVFQDMSLL